MSTPASTTTTTRAFLRPEVAPADATELQMLTDHLHDHPHITAVQPVSATKNYVLRGTHATLGVCYFKTARTDDGTSYQISVEQRMWEYVRPGSTQTLHLPTGRTVTAIKSAGHEPAQLDASLAAPLAAGLRRIHRIPTSDFADLEVQTLQRTHTYVTRRFAGLDDLTSQQTLALAHNLIDGLTNDSPTAAVVVHGDTTMLNFVLFNNADNQTRVSWIDLETAVLAPPEWDYTAFWIAATMEGLPDLADQFLDHITDIDPVAYDWSMRQLLASKLAWSAWRTAKGNATFREDLTHLTSLARTYLTEGCFTR